MKAMIFAAGLGTRLGKVTETIPKALVDINGRSALRIAIEKCSSEGFDDIIVNVHHFAELVIEEVNKLKALGFKVTVSDESDLLLETGGGLRKAGWFFDDSPFLLFNADIISGLDLSAMLKFHIERKGIATLAVRKGSGNRVFLTDSSSLLKGWRNRTTGEEILPCGSSEGLEEIDFTGIHIVNPGILRYMKEGVYSMTSLYLDIIRNENVVVFRDDQAYWADIGTPESLEAVRGEKGRLFRSL